MNFKENVYLNFIVPETRIDIKGGFGYTMATQIYINNVLEINKTTDVSLTLFIYQLLDMSQEFESSFLFLNITTCLLTLKICYYGWESSFSYNILFTTFSMCLLTFTIFYSDWESYFRHINILSTKLYFV